MSLTLSQTLVRGTGVSPDDLVVQHYVNGKWQVLNTTVVATGTTYVVSAETTGFSPFALTERPEAVTDTEAESTETGTATAAATETPAATESSIGDRTGSPTPVTGTMSGSGPLTALSALLVLLVVVLLVARRR